MIRIVVDTNVIVSALLNPRGFEARLIRTILVGRVQLYTSELILAEYEGVLMRSKFAINMRRKRKALSRLRALSIIVRPLHAIKGSPDKSDNRFLECATAAGADFLITGNKRHFPTQFRQTQIVNAREFLEMVSATFEGR